MGVTLQSFFAHSFGKLARTSWFATSWPKLCW